MNEYNEGDLIEAVKGDIRISGPLTETRYSGLGIDGMGWPVGSLIREGFTITVIEKAKPKVELPTEPGIYQYGTHGETVALLRTGDWYCHGDGSLGWEMTLEDVADFGPYTRLEPRAETAKAAANFVLRLIDNGQTFTEETVLKAIEAEFGVTK